MIRAKGLFWLATRPDFVGDVSKAGAFVRHQGIGRWWVSVPKSRWPEGEAFSQMMDQYWDEDYGDRRQEMVFIGLSAQMDETQIRAQLDACLINDYFEHAEAYHQMEDPFPRWFKQTASSVM